MSALVPEFKIIMREHYEFYLDETDYNGDIPLSFNEYVREYQEDIISIYEHKCLKNFPDD